MDYFVLVDCNNFYASCERLFNPKLERRAVVVLSNNDGCVIARSQEAKLLGLKMGESFFKIKNFCHHYQVAVCSSNYALYGDLSQRVMSILGEEAPHIEVYSIDEAFLSYPSTFSLEEMFLQCQKLRVLTKQWVGLPVSLGMGPTKTLAKLANHFAKKHSTGIYELVSTSSQEILREVPIKEIWGVGSGLQARLNAKGIFTASELRAADPVEIRRSLGVVGERLVWELRGVSCLPLEKPEPRKNIGSSRSFGRYVTCPLELAEALSTYVNTACGKLRKQKSCALAVYVYVEVITESYAGHGICHSTTIPLTYPSNDPAVLIKAAKKCLQKLYVKGCKYKKCGVMLLDLVPEDLVAPDFFDSGGGERKQILLGAIDNINARYGKNTVFYGAMGTNPVWKMRAAFRSQAFTTSWGELGIAYAC